MKRLKEEEPFWKMIFDLLTGETEDGTPFRKEKIKELINPKYHYLVDEISEEIREIEAEEKGEIIH